MTRISQLFRNFAEETIAAICPTVTKKATPRAISRESGYEPKIAINMVNSMEWKSLWTGMNLNILRADRRAPFIGRLTPFVS
jgi:hypothetical protein